MPWLSPYERRRRNDRLRWWGIGLCAGYLVCALLDRRVFLAFEGAGFREGDWARMFRVAGFLPTWLVVGAAMALIDRAPGPRGVAWRRAGPLVLGAALSGLAAEVLKRLIGRERPTHHAGMYEYKKFLHGFVDDSNLGIPSSHAAVAFGAAFMLIRLYPPMWPAALVFAVGCAVQRVAAGAHFLTDVYAAVVVAYAVTAWLSRLMLPDSGAGARSDGVAAAMKTLDRYIARTFVFNVAALFVILFCFVVAVDVSLNIDQFLKAADEVARADGRTLTGMSRGLSAAWIIFDWWWPRLLMLFNFLLGIVMVGAMGFTCSQMARNRELVAVLAGGLSLHRVGRPVVIAAIGLTLLQVANQEFALPRVAPLLTREHNDAGKRSLGAGGLALTPDGHGRVFAAHVFDADTDTLRGLYILERDESRGAVRAITAPEARWDAGTGAWVLKNGRIEPRRGEPEPATIDRVETDLDPTMLKMRRSSVYSQNLGTAKLTEMLDRPGFLDSRSREQIERIRLGRFAAMGANLLTLVIAMPFFLTRVPGNQLLRSLACAPIAIAGLIGGVLGASAAIPGLPVWLSVFIPALILAPVAIATVGAVKT